MMTGKNLTQIIWLLASTEEGMALATKMCRLDIKSCIIGSSRLQKPNVHFIHVADSNCGNMTFRHDLQVNRYEGALAFFS